jgi:hypothetical protein
LQTVQAHVFQPIDTKEIHCDKTQIHQHYHRNLLQLQILTLSQTNRHSMAIATQDLNVHYILNEFSSFSYFSSFIEFLNSKPFFEDKNRVVSKLISSISDQRCNAKVQKQVLVLQHNGCSSDGSSPEIAISMSFGIAP